MKKNILFLLVLSVLSLPVFVFASDIPPFQPIVPIPNITSVEGITFYDYVNQIFRLSISLGAILAVLMIVYGGFEYMTSEALGGKKGGLSKLQNAFGGLLLLVSVTLILQVINPCILEITVFTREGGQCSPPTVAPPLTPAQEPGGPQGPQLRDLIPRGLFPGVADEELQESGLVYCGEGCLNDQVCAGPIVDLCMPSAEEQGRNPGATATARTGNTCPENYNAMEACVAKVEGSVNLGTTLQANQLILSSDAQSAVCAGMSGAVSRYCCTGGNANCSPLADGVTTCTTGSLTRVCTVPTASLVAKTSLTSVTCANNSTRYCCGSTQCAITTANTCPISVFSEVLCVAPQAE
jgi:hypothetical protein